MQDVAIDLKFQLFPPHVHRGSHVLILLRDFQGHFILGCKAIYPDGICRLLGGGVEEGEEPDLAARRELEEETGLKVGEQELIKLGSVTAHLTDENQEQVTFVSHIYFHACGQAKLAATDDVDELCYLTPGEMHKLIERYRTLPNTIDPKVNFAWFDYGHLYSFIHQFALDEITKRSL